MEGRVRKRRTHLGEGTRGSVHSAPKRGQGEERAFEDEVDECIERLWGGLSVRQKRERKEGKASYEPNEGGAVLPRCVFGEEGSRRGRRDERNASDASEGVRGRCGENRWCLG